MPTYAPIVSAQHDLDSPLTDTYGQQIADNFQAHEDRLNATVIASIPYSALKVPNRRVAITTITADPNPVNETLHDVIIADSTSGSFNVTLKDASTLTAGTNFTVIRAGGNSVTMLVVGGTIESVASVILADKETRRWIAAGSNDWKLFGGAT